VGKDRKAGVRSGLRGLHGGIRVDGSILDAIFAPLVGAEIVVDRSNDRPLRGCAGTAQSARMRLWLGDSGKPARMPALSVLPCVGVETDWLGVRLRG
jgi:hypothetical protein